MAGSDITAALLTLDEPYAARARASLERQTLPFADVVVVRGVAPFHRALNRAAAQVRTPFFIQVDADMVLDPTCAADLRAAAAPQAGVVIGFLRDAMLGRVAGIKLFRTACFAEEQFPDSISPDTDFYKAIARRGWPTVYAIKPAAAGAPPHVFGDHAPDYSPAYTLRKFMLLGARHRYRRAAAALRQLLYRLHRSPHPAAPLGLIGTAYGIGLPTATDALTPLAEVPELCRLQRLLAGGGRIDAGTGGLHDLAALGAAEIWQRGVSSGRALAEAAAADAFLAAVRQLASSLGDASGTPALVALAGLCHGALAAADDAAAARALAHVNTVLPRPYRLETVEGR